MHPDFHCVCWFLRNVPLLIWSLHYIREIYSLNSILFHRYDPWLNFRSFALSFTDSFCTNPVGSSHPKEGSLWRTIPFWLPLQSNPRVKSHLFCHSKSPQHHQYISGQFMQQTQLFHIWRSVPRPTSRHPCYEITNNVCSDLRDINLQHASLICYAWINIPLVYTQVVAVLKSFKCEY